MSRPLRLEYPGAWYHVMNRGLAKQLIFHTDAHRQLFLGLLFDIHHRYQIEIHAYCLMGNHYHLFIRTPLANLSRAMRHLNGVYTQRYNQQMNRDGPIFRGRYKSIVVDADVYLLRLSRYIHLNPVAAKLVKQAEAYPWSSYPAYLKKSKEPLWLRTGETLDYFGKKSYRQKYKAFVEEGIDKELDNYFKKLKRIPILGSEAFIKTVSEKYLQESHKIKDIPAHKQIESIPSLEKIAQVITSYYQLDNSDLKKSKRGEGNIPRMAFMYLAQRFGQYDLLSISSKVGNIGAAGVSRSCRVFCKRLSEDSQVKKDIEKCVRYCYEGLKRELKFNIET